MDMKAKLLEQKAEREANLNGLRASISALEANLEQMRVNAHAMVGAIQQLDILIAALDAAEKEAAKPVEAPAVEKQSK